MDASVAAGAVRAAVATAPAGACFYPPTLLTGVQPGMPAWDEELFGPVAALRVVPDAASALAAANDSQYGLGAAIWTRNPLEQARFLAGLRAGTLVLNGIVRSDSRLPFGGVADSGFGRELGREGFWAFTNTQAIIIDER